MTRIRSARTLVRAHRRHTARQGPRPLPFLRAQPAPKTPAAPSPEAARWARILAESGWADEDPDVMASLREALPY